jgi:adenylate cyclase
LQRLVDRAVTSRLLGGHVANGPAAHVQQTVRAITGVVVTGSHLIGVFTVATFGLLILPQPPDIDVSITVPVNLTVSLIYTVVAVIAGRRLGRATLEAGPNGTSAWLPQGHTPNDAQQARALQAPFRLMWLQLSLWVVGAAMLAIVNLAFHPLLALGLGLTTLLGGLTTSSAAYMAGELALRPITGRALAASGHRADGVPGVAVRWLLTWGFGTAAPVLGVLFLGIAALTPLDIDAATLALAVVALSALTLLFGSVVTVLAAYATVHPLASIERGMARVAQGDLSVELRITDTTEVGTLQRGFNAMVQGLRERQRVEDLFSRQVGADVADRSISHGVQLGGDVKAVTVLLVDLVGSTALAAREHPERVVHLLNRFLAVVVEEVERHDGWINKFMGDAALAVFGAPTPLEAPARSGLRAARLIQARLVAEVPELSAAIGVASGDVVAGHIGTEQRFEYTVIGDPVNEAARLCALAKSEPQRVAASWATVEQAALPPAPDGPAGDGEAHRWVRGETVVLRGRTDPTVVAVPAPSDELRGPAAS